MKSVVPGFAAVPLQLSLTLTFLVPELPGRHLFVALRQLQPEPGYQPALTSRFFCFYS